MNTHDELDSFVQATIAAPLDDAPRFVFQDWLDDHADTYPEQAANWRWYWQELVPRFRGLLTDTSWHLRGNNSHYQHLGNYFPRILFRNMKPALVPLWAAAVVRTFVDQSGESVFGRAGIPYQKYVAVIESSLIYPHTLCIHDNFYAENLADVKYRVVTIIRNNNRVYVHRITRPKSSDRYTTAPNWSVYTIPSTNNEVDTFINQLRACLQGYEEQLSLTTKVGSLIPKHKYDSILLIPGWLSETQKTASASYKKHRKVVDGITESVLRH